MKHVTTSLTDLPYTLVNYGRYADATGKPNKDQDALLPDRLIECLNAWQNVACGERSC